MTTDGNNMIMPVAPTGGFGGNGFGGWGSDVWIILLVLFAFGGFGGWGGMGGFGGGYMGGYDFPWLLASNANNQNSTQSSFDNLATQNSISALQSAVTSGFGDTQLGIAGINQNICSSTGQIVQAVNGGFSAAEVAANARQMANMQQSFANQTAMAQGFNGVTAQVAQVGCDNRYAIAGLSADLAREACANRTVDTQNTQSIINSFNAGLQSIKDQMYQDKLDAKNDTIAQLRSEILYARGQASQDVQTAAIQAGQRALANEVEQYVAPRPIPSYIVQSPYCCNQTVGCGNGFYN
jgi:hypothetical protein